MSDSQYKIVVYWSNDDRVFIAEVPDLPGCAADGATYQEALHNVEIIVREWIVTATELGRPVPEMDNEDDFVDRLLKSNTAFRALVERSKASPRSPFPSS